MKKLFFRGVMAALAMVVAVPASQAASFKVLHTFMRGTDGAEPHAGVVKGKDGNLYGTTGFGGHGASCAVRGGVGCGTVYKITSDGTVSVIYAFKGGDDGILPESDLVIGRDGAFYGTTQWGGGSSDCNSGCGTIFRVTPDGAESIVHVFRADGNGFLPIAGLTRDRQGNLYGTATSVIFKLSFDGAFTVLRTFTGADGWNANGGVILDDAGNLYGTTSTGGNMNCSSGGCGTVFKLAADGTFSTLHFFLGDDGAVPAGRLTLDTAGNLYGTTEAGGHTLCENISAYGCVTVFKIATDGTETLVHSFSDRPDGAEPRGAVVFDRFGNLFGTTAKGGATIGACARQGGCGTVFKVAPDGTESVLHVFQKVQGDGQAPSSNLYKDGRGNLFGTAMLFGLPGGTSGYGTVFEVQP